MKTIRSITLLGLMSALTSSYIGPGFSQPTQIAEPNPQSTAEFFGTEHAKPEEKRRLAENGCKYGWYAVNRGYFYSAEEAFSKAIEIDPSCACGYFGMARIKKIRKEDQESARYYQEAIKRDPTLATADNEEKVNDPTTPKSPRNPHTDAIVATKMGWQFFDEKNYDMALNSFQLAVEQDPSYSSGYFGVAYIYSIQHKLDQAVHYYRETLKRDDTYPPVYANLAFALLLLKHDEEAKKVLDEALKRDAKQGDAVMNFACCYAERGQWDVAKKYYVDAVRRGCTPRPDIAKEFKKHGITAPDN